MKFDIAHAQANAYTTNTTFINECILNDGLHIHDYINLSNTSYSKANAVNISCAELSHLDGSTSNIQTQQNLKAPINNPKFTRTIGGISKSMIGWGNVDNTSNANKPISTTTQSTILLTIPNYNIKWPTIFWC